MIALTANTYSHVMPSMMQDMADKMDTILNSEIADSVASTRLRSLIPLRPIRDFQIPTAEHADSECADYVRRFTNLYQFIAAQGLPVTVRSLLLLFDMEWIGYGGECGCIFVANPSMFEPECKSP